MTAQLQGKRRQSFGPRLQTINGGFQGVLPGRDNDDPVNADKSPDAPASDARRAAFQAGWDARLLPLLTAEWQSSVALAKQLGEKPATVLERLKDMLERNLVDRRVVKAVPSKPTKSGKRPRIHTARFEAHFRLPR
jgi:hypothetical protein